MMKRQFRKLLALCVLSAAIIISMAAQTTLWASKNAEFTDTDLSVILHRTGKSIEVYIKMPAHLMQSGFGLPLERLKNADGEIDYPRLRQGTFDIGDELMSNVVSTNNDEPFLLEAMSLMVHPKEEVLPFDNPVQAELSVGVCSTETPDVPPTIDELTLYSGFIGYTDQIGGEIEITLPKKGRELSVQVRDFTDGELVNSYRTDFDINGALKLQRSSPTSWWAALLG